MLKLLLYFLLFVFASSLRIHKGIHIRAANRYGRQTYSKSELHQVDSYLRRYGYLDDHPKESLDEPTNEDRTAAIQRFQGFNHIPVTGQVDSDTTQLLSKPRCAVPDMVSQPNTAPGGANTGPVKLTLGNKWEKSNIDWRLNSFSTNINRADLLAETRRAFNKWGEIANLNFTERSFGRVDIMIDFFTGHHHDGIDNAFDGPGNVLAHAYFPPNGDVHFDDAEPWVVNRTGIEYYTVALHEIGHSLGMGHSEITEALMAPFYPGFSQNLDFHSDDIAGIQALYGLRSRSAGPPLAGPPFAGPPLQTSTRRPPLQTSTRRPRSARPNICNLQFNAVLKDSNGELLAFVGRNRLLRIRSTGGLITNMLQRDRFSNSPFRPNAAFMIPGSSQYNIIRGRFMYNFNSRGNMIGRNTMYRRGTAALALTSRDVSVFDGDLVWKINPNTGRTMPRSLRYLRNEYPGVPNDIDAAVLKNSNEILFFRRGEMYTFDRRAREVIRNENVNAALMPNTCNQ